MNRAAVGIIAALVAVLGIGGIVYVSSNGNDSKNDHSEHADDEQSTNTESSANSEQSANREASQTSTVEIKDYAYAPTKIQVKKGTKVTWTNQDSVRHDVNPDSESDNFKASELLAKGESYSFTFNTVGTYTYHCSPHPYMKGTVEVVE